MSGKRSRTKGAVGQTAVKNMLLDRDWRVAQLTAGVKSEDILAIDPSGKEWSVEVKNCASILPAHKRQAMEQAEKRGRPWMLVSKLSGTSSWVVQRQGVLPDIWR